MTGGWGGFRRGDIDEGPPPTVSNPDRTRIESIEEAAERLRRLEKEENSDDR